MSVEHRAEALVTGMREAIDAFAANRMPIDRLAWELKNRIAALDECADPKWVDELRAFRNQLEIVNAFFIDSGRSTLNDDERKQIDEVLGELNAALTPY